MYKNKLNLNTKNETSQSQRNLIRYSISIQIAFTQNSYRPCGAFTQVRCVRVIYFCWKHGRSSMSFSTMK